MPRRHRDVLELLIAQIVQGHVEPGTRLPKETDLADEHGVSRGVVREVIRALEERHLVAVTHGRGATVLPAARWDLLDADVLAAVLGSPQGAAILGEYLECRRILEIEAAGLAAERATEEDVEALRAALDRMRAAAALPAGSAAETRFHEADLAFHARLIDCAGNRALSGLVERIHAALLTVRYATARPEYRETRALPEHEALLKAVAAGRPAAARKAMAAHLATVAAYLREDAA